MTFWAPQAWIAGRWAERVLLQAGADGCWAEIATDMPAPPHAEVLAGPVLPGLVDAHSHAFQRAFAGLAERREAAADDFWSWRDRMYRVALRITPEQLRAVAAMLYAELLRGGYTQVCEFHYLQHAPNGRPYADPLTLSWALADAAGDVGLGLTMLPVLYQRAGFAQAQLRGDQRRFATDAAAVRALQRGLAASGRPLVNAGVAIHSLRAAEPAAIAQLVEGLGDLPIHVHVAEQTAEVDDCLRATGLRPIEWLATHVPLDARWQLVHATHAQPSEIDAVAKRGAGVVICPSTEGNLGDGFTDVPGWLDAGVPMAIGSDSHVVRAWPEELRWLEYGQRLLRRQRNVCAAPAQGEPATAARLFERALTAGGAAAGHARWGLQTGARADLLVLDRHESGLRGIPPPRLLDALVFSGTAAPFRDVLVAGRWALREHRLAGTASGPAFDAAMQTLWSSE
jgi:formimidoylglutamate deiminase